MTWRQVALGLSLCLATASPLVQAQDGGAAAAALKILMTPPAAPAVQASPGALMASPTGTTPAAPAPTPAQPATAMLPLADLPTAMGKGVVLVQRGDTLDRIIRRSLGETPFSADFLRKAFVQLNPHAFRATGNPHLVSAGSMLRVPTAAQLQQLMQAYFPHSPALLDEAQTGPSHATDAEARKRWVRYP